MRNKLFLGLMGAALAAGMAGCAGLYGKGAKSVAVARNERLFLRVEPFDSVVVAELARAGIDPARMGEEFDAEVRYGLFLLQQEEAQDSAGAAVVVSVRVRHLQPGAGNAGTFAAFTLTAWRAGDSKTDSAGWAWSGRAKDNVPQPHAARHLARLAAREVLARLAPPKKEYEPPPPLHLMK